MWYLMVDLEADPQFRHTALEDDDSEDSDSDVDEYSEHSKRRAGTTRSVVLQSTTSRTNWRGR